MSITTYPLKSLTGLIPSIVYGVNNAGTSSLEMNYDNGLTMNVAGGGIAIQDLNGNSITTAYTTNLQLISGQGQITMGSYDNMNITSDQQTFITTGKAITIESLNDNTSLFNPSGAVYVDKSSSFIGDGIINAGSLTLHNSNGNNQIEPTSITIDTSNIGDTASIILNGAGGYAILGLSDGVNSNSITALGYTTKNSVQNATQYLNFTSSSSTGVGAIQKTAGISCNPSTNSITATTFNGTATNATNATNAINCSTTSTTTAGTYYPVFVSSNVTGNYPNLVGTMTYNPSSNTITANTFNGVLSGTATNSTNSVIGTDNVSTLVYPTFVKTSGAGNKGLYIDDTTTTLTYNPSTGNLSATTFTGALSGNSTTATTATNSNNSLIVSDNSSTTCYIPFTKSTASTGTNLPLYQDDTTTPLSYTPSTSTLSCSYGQFGSGIINTSSLACNSSGGLTITGGSSGGLILNSGANTLQLQNNGTTIATIQSTGLAVSQINATSGFSIYNGAFTPFSIAPSSGISTFSNIITTGLALPTSFSTATFATNTLTISGLSTSTFRNYQIGFTGTTNTITTLSITSMLINAEYYVAIYNGGSGTLTINATGLGSSIKTTYSSNITIATLGYAIMKINYLPFTTGGNIYVVSVNNVG